MSSMVKASEVALALMPSAPLARIEDLRALWAQMAGKANLVSPVASVDAILPMHRVSVRAVVIDHHVDGEGNGPECYKGKFCVSNERALGKVALDKIQAAAGVQTIYRQRLDDRSAPYYCEIEVQLGMQDFDGTTRVVTKARAVDLRDGAPDAQTMLGWKNGKVALAQARGKIQELCETKAGFRALRTLLSIKQKYSIDELSKPFVVPKLVPALDPSDPDQKAALIRMAEGGNRALFGPPAGEMRQLRDVTPPPTIPAPGPGKPPPPVGSVPPADEEEDDGGEQASFDLPDFTPPEPPKKEEPALILCLCPCGDQTEISADVARITTEKVGAPRCKACYPNKDFDFGRHQDLPRGGLLNLPKHPDLTAEKVRAANERAAAAKR